MKPKYLERKSLWNTERATSQGEWPFESQNWKVTYYPYTHDKEDTILWLETLYEHKHGFPHQNVSKVALLPEYDPNTSRYEIPEESQYCYMCGKYLEDDEKEFFDKCREIVILSIKR